MSANLCTNTNKIESISAINCSIIVSRFDFFVLKMCNLLLTSVKNLRKINYWFLNVTWFFFFFLVLNFLFFTIGFLIFPHQNHANCWVFDRPNLDQASKKWINRTLAWVFDPLFYNVENGRVLLEKKMKPLWACILGLTGHIAMGLV